MKNTETIKHPKETVAKAKYFYSVPYAPSDLIDVTSDKVKVLERNLLIEANKAVNESVGAVVRGEDSVSHPDPSFITQAACYTCRGRCCKQGLQNSGFITSAQFHKLRKEDPSKTLDQLVGYYLSKVPNRHVEGFCLFLSANGCTIPRGNRSKVCNNYLCSKVKVIQRTQKTNAGGEEPVMIISVSENMVQRAYLFQNGMQPIAIDD